MDSQNGSLSIGERLTRIEEELSRLSDQIDENTRRSSINRWFLGIVAFVSGSLFTALLPMLLENLITLMK